MKKRVSYIWEVWDIHPGLYVFITAGDGQPQRPYVVARRTRGEEPKFASATDRAKYWKACGLNNEILNLVCIDDGSMSHETWVTGYAMAEYLTLVNAKPVGD